MAIKKIVSKVLPKTVAPEVVKEEKPVITPAPGFVPCVVCGKPVAPGQNYVCQEHERSS